MTTQLAGHMILVVEEELSFSRDLAGTLKLAGAFVVTTACLGEATSFLQNFEFSAALVDYTIGAQDDSILFRRLSERDIPSCDPEAIVDTVAVLLGEVPYERTFHRLSKATHQPIFRWRSAEFGKLINECHDRRCLKEVGTLLH